MHLTTAVLLSLAAQCFALPSPSTHVLHEKRSTTPRLWRRTDRVDPNSILPIRIGLSQSNLHNAVDHLMDVSDPTSPNFGKHWTPEQVHSTFAPSAEAVDEVRAWLVGSGIVHEKIVHSENRGWLALDIPAWQAEELFRTEYHEYEHVQNGGDKVKVGCDEYHVPAAVAGHIDYVTPGVALSSSLIRSKVKREVKRSPEKRKPESKPKEDCEETAKRIRQPQAAVNDRSADLSNCNTLITPACLQALYNITTVPRNDGVNSLGVYESYDTYAQEDLNLFWAKYAPNVPNGTHPILKSIDGGEAPTYPEDPANEGESAADLQIAHSLLYPQTVTLYQVDDINQSGSGFNTFLDALDGSYCTYSAYGETGNDPDIDAVYPDPLPGGYTGKLMCGVYKPTRVISISVGNSEQDQPVNYSRRQCDEYLKLGLQGVSVIMASGDSGVAGQAGDLTPSGCLGEDDNVFNPNSIACPWVTTVGATMLTPGQTVQSAESGMDLYHRGGHLMSSGGFSNYFSAPLYQKAAVAAYFLLHDPGHTWYKVNLAVTNIGANGGVYNRAGRAYPDVSANGANFPAFVALEDEPLSYGSSLSAPVFASMITLINQERTAIGKGSLGFLNPTLYLNPLVFNDIKNGSNPGCGSSGFSAVTGWDPITGLGTPSYPKLLKLLKSLP